MNSFLKYATDDSNSLGITVNLWKSINIKQFILTALYVVVAAVALFAYKIVVYHLLPKTSFFLLLENIVFYLLTGAAITLSFFVINKINKFTPTKNKKVGKLILLGCILAIPQMIFYTINSAEISAYFLSMVDAQKYGGLSNHVTPLLKYFAIPSIINGFIMFTMSSFIVHLSLNPNRYKTLPEYFLAAYKSFRMFTSMHTSITNIICFNMLFTVTGLFIIFITSGFILGFVSNVKIAGLTMFIITISSFVVAILLFFRNMIGSFFRIYEKGQIRYAGTNKAFTEEVSFGVGVCQYIIPNPSVLVS